MGPEAPTTPETAAVIRDIERRRLRSLVEADVVTADALHAADFQLVNPSGGVWSKEHYLGGIASGSIDYRRFDASPTSRSWSTGTWPLFAIGQPSRSRSSLERLGHCTAGTRTATEGSRTARPGRWSGRKRRQSRKVDARWAGLPGQRRCSMTAARGKTRGRAGHVDRGGEVPWLSCTERVSPGAGSSSLRWR